MIAALTKLVAIAHFVWVYSVALHVIAVLAPHVHDDRAALGIARVLETDAPLPGDDGWLTEATLLANEREESTFDVDAIGDHGRAFGANQIWKRRDLMEPTANTREALRQIRVSFEMCPRSPFSMYLSGKCLTTGRVARQSDRRMARVGQILAIMAGKDISGAEARR